MNDPRDLAILSLQKKLAAAESKLALANAGYETMCSLHLEEQERAETAERALKDEYARGWNDAILKERAASEAACSSADARAEAALSRAIAAERERDEAQRTSVQARTLLGLEVIRAEAAETRAAELQERIDSHDGWCDAVHEAEERGVHAKARELETRAAELGENAERFRASMYALEERVHAATADAATLRARVVELEAERDTKHAALIAINEIRKSIAEIESLQICHENFGTMLERTLAAETETETLRATHERLRGLVVKAIEYMPILSKDDINRPRKDECVRLLREALAATDPANKRERERSEPELPKEPKS